MKSLEDILPADEEMEKKLRKTSVFIGKLFLLGILFRITLLFRPDTYFLQAELASITGTVLSAFNVNLAVDGALLVGEESSYLVTQDCLGWKSVFGFTGLVLASTENISKELKPILIGTLIILIVNLVRVVTTVYLSYQNVISFDIIHTLFWKWGLTFLILVMWISWLQDAGSKIKGTFKYQSTKF